MGRCFPIGWGLVGMLVLAACVGQPPVPDKHREAPAWLDQIPSSKEELCAVGVSGPTYYAQDAMASSKALALTELARGLQVQIRSEMLVRQRGDSVGRSEMTVDEVSKFVTEAVIKLAQVRDQWVNPRMDQARGTAGTVYTLVCMPLKAVEGTP